MIVIDYISDLLTEYGDLTAQERLNYWLTHNKKDVIERCIHDYQQINVDYRKYAIENVFSKKKHKPDRILYVVKTIKKNINEVVDKVRSAYGLYLDDIQIIIYHGLANAAGEATNFRGKPTIFFGVEKVVDLGWDNEEKILNLIVHEYAHLIHESLQKDGLERVDPHEKDVYRLYVEGFATYMEDIYAGREKSEWFQECLEKEDDLKSECFKRMTTGISCKEFFGDWWKVLGLSDTGYFLGYRFIKQLLNRFGLVEIGRFDYHEVEEQLYYFLKFRSGR